MNFGEKVKELRLSKHLQQKELAELVGVSLRTITGWEKEGRFPKRQEIYTKLATIFGCDENYLKTTEESFITDVSEQFGSRGGRQARMILEQANAMFAGGELSEADKVAFMDQIQEMYLDSKRKAKKYTRKDYLPEDLPKKES